MGNILSNSEKLVHCIKFWAMSLVIQSERHTEAVIDSIHDTLLVSNNYKLVWYDDYVKDKYMHTNLL